jgi:hypothetical protein
VQYGEEYHGMLNRTQTDEVLGSEEGSYLVRLNPTGIVVLSFR